MKPDYFNDIVQNSYFKLLGWSNELRVKMSDFLKDSPIYEDKIRKMLIYKF